RDGGGGRGGRRAAADGVRAAVRGAKADRSLAGSNRGGALMSTPARPWLEEGAGGELAQMLESAVTDEPRAEQLQALEARLAFLFTVPPGGGPAPGGGGGA